MIYFTPLLDLTGRYDKLVGDNFRIYSDTVSGNVVNLDLVKVKFTVTNETIQLEIPIEFWELIRTKSFVNFDIAEKTDKEIEKAVRETVVDRIKHQDRSEKSSRHSLNQIYGYASESEDKQVENGILYFKTEQKRVLDILNFIKTNGVKLNPDK